MTEIEANFELLPRNQMDATFELNVVEKGDKGDKGDPGNGIESIEKTSTHGLVDTYTIQYTDGNSTTFDVTNGSSIQSIEKTDTNVLVDTYTITLTNGDTSTFEVTNGKGISSIAKTSTSGLVDTYTITYNDNTTSTFDVTNGKDATINGVNALVLETAFGITISQSGDTATISGKELQDQIDNLKARGRFLALWNCATGLAETNPPESPYTYQAGDYFIVGTVASGSGTNYRPNGSSYTTGVASTTVETNEVAVDDVYYYDGTNWRLQSNTQKTITFANVAGSPYDNTNLSQALNSKQATITGGASTITSENLTANRALISNAQGKVAVSPVTNTELGYLSGATSPIQTQLNEKTRANFSNCVTEIPLDVILTLANGVLTVKAGTKFYTAGGSNYSIASDTTVTVGATDGQYFIFPQTDGTVVAELETICYSGTSAPTGFSGSAVWLDTTNKVIKKSTDSGSTWSNTTYGLPIALVTVSSSDWKSIDRVFNGFGYMGASLFVLPGVKGLSPNGFNADGTMKSYGITSITNLLIATRNSAATFMSSRFANAGLILQTQYKTFYSKPTTVTDNWMIYVINENRAYVGVSGAWIDSGGWLCCGPTITKSQTGGYGITNFHTPTVIDYTNLALYNIHGYDATKTQTLKNVNGLLTWVTDS